MPLDYATPKPRRPYSRLALVALVASAISGPIGALSAWVLLYINTNVVALRLLPVGVATAISLWAFWHIEPIRHSTRGLWIAGVALLIDAFWVLCLCAAPL
jgi:hypothetical protein